MYADDFCLYLDAAQQHRRMPETSTSTHWGSHNVLSASRMTLHKAFKGTSCETSLRSSHILAWWTCLFSCSLSSNRSLQPTLFLQLLNQSCGRQVKCAGLMAASGLYSALASGESQQQRQQDVDLLGQLYGLMADGVLQASHILDTDPVPSNAMLDRLGPLQDCAALAYVQALQVCIPAMPWSLQILCKGLACSTAEWTDVPMCACVWCAVQVIAAHGVVLPGLMPHSLSDSGSRQVSITIELIQ